ncbi:MAG TPA: hypothetical protein VG711_01260, partial [Phycisphaerales bacterium]|nr:hypothetical protein [Phycisphaerales bacterium]
MKGVIVLAAVGVLAKPVFGAQVVAHFTTTVSFVNSAATGFPASLSGVTVGTAVNGTIQYDAAATPISNGFPSPYNQASLYEPAGMIVSLKIGSVTLDTWSGPIAAFVWNNDVISGNTVDALLYVNLAASGSTVMQIGNLQMNTTTFMSEALPSRTVNGGLVAELLPSFSGSAFLRTNAITNLTFSPVPVCTADIAPSP